MKKSIFVVTVTLLLLNALSCKTANKSPESRPDWAGTYAGVTPSASGEGIDVKITLNADKTYTKASRYVGKGDEVFTDTGTFQLNPDGVTVTLNVEKGGGPVYFKLGENILTQLDLEGNVITGEFAGDYVLKKQ